MTMRFDEQEEGEDIVETDQMIFYQINEEIEQNIHIVKWEVAELGLENENISRRIERIRGNLNNEMIKWQTMTVR